MKAAYRIIQEGTAVYLEVGYPFLWFYLWRRTRDYYADSLQHNANGPYINYRTLAAAQRELARYQQAATPAMPSFLSDYSLAFA